MGQLEKYGLYVLCLVIFLIVGVSIWGVDMPDANRARNGARTPELNANTNTRTNAAVGSGTAATPVTTPSVDMLLGPGGSGSTGSSGNVAGGAGSNQLGNAKDANASKPPAGRLGTDVPAPTPVIETKPVKVPEPSTARATHKVVAGDSFASISRQHFGTEAAVPELQRLNPTINASRLQVNTVLQLPSKAELERVIPAARTPATGSNTGSGTGSNAGNGAGAAPAPAAGARTYTVAAGDTFEGIALRLLGSRARVEDLRELNPNVDPTRLRIGTQIRLPKK